ncbi:uncharacterized protein LOC116167857 isoform X2 [Photinus pyralis]|nr:uncharacterized protein LOC116167857 isoform X2 [Photinus pyralis]
MQIKMQQSRQRRPHKKQDPQIEDLREKLNRMRVERSNSDQEEIKKAPPRDPPYNFLKDPLRDDPKPKRPQAKNPPKPKPNLQPKDVNTSPRPTQERHYRSVREVQEFLKKPINVNVEVSTESGQRKCVLDETKVVEISFTNKQYPKRPQFRRQPGDFHKYHGDDSKTTKSEGDKRN